MEIKNRITELRMVEARELLPNPRNWRRHPVEQANALRGSLAEIGYADALIAYETPAGLMLIDGHLRAETTPDSTVPVLVTDLDESEANLILATLDPLAAMANADLETFEALRKMTDVESEALAAVLQSISDEQLHPLMSKKPGPIEGHTDPDDVPPVEQSPWVQEGDLFQLGEHRLLCGDATSPDSIEVLMGGNTIDVIFTDPPYNVDYSSKNELLNLYDNLYDKGNHIQAPIQGDRISAIGYQNFCESYYLATEPFLSDTNSIYICGNYESLIPYYKLGSMKISNMLVWVKNTLVIGRMDYQNRHEFILYGWSGKHRWYSDRKQSTVWEIPKPHKSELHPTMKPVELVEKAIANSSEPGNIIYDSFSGSGTTIIASERLGRRCYAMEIDPRYVQVVIERWEAFTQRKAVQL